MNDIPVVRQCHQRWEHDEEEIYHQSRRPSQVSKPPSLMSLFLLGANLSSRAHTSARFIITGTYVYMNELTGIPVYRYPVSSVPGTRYSTGTTTYEYRSHGRTFAEVKLLYFPGYFSLLFLHLGKTSFSSFTKVSVEPLNKCPCIVSTLCYSFLILEKSAIKDTPQA
jgi:hypothetical protein